MKRFVPLALTLVLIFLFCSCRGKAPSLPVATPTVRPVSLLNATIADIKDGSLLLAGIDENSVASDLFTADYAGVTVLDVDGKTCDAAELKPGMNVAVEYDGDISGNTLARKITILKISIINGGNDLIGFYLDTLENVFTNDDSLNADIKTIGFDFSKLGNLRESEKSALMYLMSKAEGLEYVSGTYEELGAKGLIDTKKLYFPTGVLLKIVTRDEKNDSFTFDISKWRGGDGAIGSNNCKAALKGNVWSYTPGESWIS